MTHIKGNSALAKELMVSRATIQRWRNSGILKPATIIDYGSTIVYDLNKVYNCLQYTKAKAGRPAR